MKKSLLLLTILFALSMCVFSLSACGDKKEAVKNGGNGDDSDLPEVLKEIKDYTLELAVDYAKKLDGEFGDWHAEMVKSGKGEKFKGFEEKRKELAKLSKESMQPGRTYISTMIPGEDADNDPFNIAIDAYLPDPLAYGTADEDEWYYFHAYDGKPTASGYAYYDEEDYSELYWCACAPIHDSDGNIVAIICVEFPADEGWDYPEWCVDEKEWNGVEFLY